MRTLLIALLITSVFSFAEESQDKDTVPLTKKTPQFKTVNPAIDPDALISKKGEGGPPADANVKEDPNLPKPYIAALEIYGTKRVTEAGLRQALGKDLEVWIEKGLSGENMSLDMETKLAAKVREKFGFAFAEWSVVQYFEPGDFAIYLTLDVVEKEDVASRMPFTKEPTEQFKDPEGLIKTWQEYEDIALDLVQSGQLQPEVENCVAFHCPFGHKHAKLKKYEKVFVEGVKKNEKALADILAKDKREDFRADAAFLLAYVKDGNKLINYLMPATKDSHPRVRNNALRVLGDVAEFHPALLIPPKPVIDALNYPKVSDRSKALFVLRAMVSNSQDAKAELLKYSVPALIQILGAKQPDHKELAHLILRKISGKEFAASDAPAWEAWYSKLPKARNTAGSPGK